MPRRVAALDHEVRDDAVEDDAVVEAVLGELLEVLHGLRRVVVEQFDAIAPLLVWSVAWLIGAGQRTARARAVGDVRPSVAPRASSLVPTGEPASGVDPVSASRDGPCPSLA